MRTKLILLALIIIGFVYWRGLKAVTANDGLNCDYHIVYAFCTAKNNKAHLPSLLDIFKAGVKF